jgi:hypothetical protein
MDYGFSYIYLRYKKVIKVLFCYAVFYAIFAKKAQKRKVYCTLFTYGKYQSHCTVHTYEQW